MISSLVWQIKKPEFFAIPFALWNYLKNFKFFLLEQLEYEDSNFFAKRSLSFLRLYKFVS